MTGAIWHKLLVVARRWRSMSAHGRPVELGGVDLSKLQLLRSEKNAEEKNNLMMYVLTRAEWYQAFRKKLRLHRTGGAPMPAYPSEQMERVETLVDDLIRATIDPKYMR